MKLLKLTFICIIGICLCLASCRKEDIITTDSSVKLLFNRNIIQFDTVFTQMGSATMNFKVKNTNKNGVKTNISLAGGKNSYFRINVDGKPGTSFQNKEIAGSDSMYVFVELTLDGSNANNPFIIRDSIIFQTNGNTQYVKLQAWGQNAVYLRHQTITTPMDNTRPYVILDTVIVPKNYSLVIDKGTKLYFHAGGIMIVLGSLIVKGDLHNPVIFQGDRLERDITYTKGPGQWQGIYIADSSTGNDFNYAIIQNADFGIYDFLNSWGTAGGIKTSIHKCIIRNMTSFGILGLNSEMNIDNTLIYNTGKQAVVLDGGTYRINQCTFDNSNSIFERHSSTMYLTNQDINLQSGPVAAPLAAYLVNVIAYGTLDDEVSVDLYSSSPADTFFRGCILKSKNYTFGGANYINKDPGFKNLTGEDYHLSAGSAFVGKGWNTLTPFPNYDLEGKSWNSKPSPGCYSQPE